MQAVIIYTTPICPYCIRAKNLLQSKGVNYQEISVAGSQQKRQEMIALANGAYTVPQIFIGDMHIGGCDELYSLERQQRLDPLLQKQQNN